VARTVAGTAAAYLTRAALRHGSRWARKGYRAIASRFRSKSKGRGRFPRRVRGQFVKSVGMKNVVYATHVARGSHHLDAGVNTTMNDLVTFYMNNPKYVTSGAGNLPGNAGPATGYDHMAALYRHWQVIGCTATFQIRPHGRLFKDTSGGDVSVITSPFKVGLYVNEGATLGNDGFGKWTDIAMTANPIKTLAPEVASASRTVFMRKNWSLKKWIGGTVTPHSDYGGTDNVSPAKNVEVHIWEQVADMLNAPVASLCAWELSWTIKYLTKWSELKTIESDMKQDIPS